MSATISLRRRVSDWFKREDGRVKLSYIAQSDPSDDDIEAVRRGLVKYNEQFTGDVPQQKLGCFVRDEANRVVGGGHGTITWGWLYIERLWVDEALRAKGVGGEVLARLERLALSEGVFRFHVGTTSFQALDFYIKQGYEVYAQLEDNPPGYTDYSLKKIIDLNP